MSKVQRWLESQAEYNTEEKRGKIKELDISKKGLEGALDLSNFVSLEKLNCAYNQLSAINLSNCLQLKDFDCSFNKLTNLVLTKSRELERISCNDNYLNSFDYSVLNADKLISLNISDNNLPNQDLSVFSQLVNLKTLLIGGNSKSHFDRNIYNKFSGSLEPLKNLTQLKSLYVDNTDVNNGIEHLPESLKYISYSTERRPESKVKEIAEQLEWIGKHFSGKQLKEWIKIGFQPKDYEFVAYLKQKGYHPQPALNYEKLREDYNKSYQGWLNKNYPREKRLKILEMHLSEVGLGSKRVSLIFFGSILLK